MYRFDISDSRRCPPVQWWLKIYVNYDPKSYVFFLFFFLNVEGSGHSEDLGNDLPEVCHAQVTRDVTRWQP